MNINLISYNLHGQIIRQGNILFDLKNNSVTMPSGKIYSIIEGFEFVYKIQRNDKSINCINGINGLLKFINSINSGESAFNPCLTNVFINL